LSSRSWNQHSFHFIISKAAKAYIPPLTTREFMMIEKGRVGTVGLGRVSSRRLIFKLETVSIAEPLQNRQQAPNP